VELLVEIDSAGADDDDDAVLELDGPRRRRRMSDTYIGIVVGVLAVVILLIVVVSVVVGVRLRRRKYSTSPSKFVFASASLHRDSVDYPQTLPLGAVRFVTSPFGLVAVASTRVQLWRGRGRHRGAAARNKTVTFCWTTTLAL